MKIITFISHVVKLRSKHTLWAILVVKGEAKILTQPLLAQIDHSFTWIFSICYELTFSTNWLLLKKHSNKQSF